MLFLKVKNKKKLLLVCFVILMILCLCTSAFGFLIWKYVINNDDGDEWLPKLADSMGTFESDSEFDNYVNKLLDDYEVDEDKFNVGLGDTSMAPQSAEESESNESITNVQEAGVDEGDIVKVYKDYFIILRRGRIFTVKLDDGNLQKVDKINAYPGGFSKGTWYDEMLIYKNKIVIVGYSYNVSATEIGIFKISEDGQLTHEGSHYLDSNDYYSSRNYASRLIDNELVFYMPYYMISYDYLGPVKKRKIQFPKVRTWIEGNKLTEGKDILSKTDIYKPVQDVSIPTLHTIVKCDLDSSDFSCSAKAFMGPYSRTFYVSPHAVYVWVSDDSYYYSENDKKEDQYAYVYMIYLEDESTRVLKAQGSPIDQFSFKETTDGYLNVLVADQSSGGEAMWNSESARGQLALMRVNIEKFTDKPEAVSKSSYTKLSTPSDSYYALQNRFVGDFIVYGEGSSWYSDDERSGTVYVKNYLNDDKTEEVNVSYGVERIDIIGDGAVVIGSAGNDLKFTSIELKRGVETKDTFTLKNASQGETRSHGFFYKQLDSSSNPLEKRQGIIGLPVRRDAEAYESLWEDSSFVQFVSVDKNKGLSDLGKLVSEESEIDDNCKYSCVDWYGNSRPIFYSGRIFALMGYELVEGEISDNDIDELGRINYYLK